MRFFARVQQECARLDFDPEKPLNLEKTGKRGLDARADTAQGMEEIRAIEKELAQLRTLVRAVETPEEKRAINAKIQRYLADIERLERNIKSAVKTQASLFGSTTSTQRITGEAKRVIPILNMADVSVSTWKALGYSFAIEKAHSGWRALAYHKGKPVAIKSLTKKQSDKILADIATDEKLSKRQYNLF